MLTINNTLDGYLKDVEIKGNTIQDSENLADIRSVGDKVEGQELYEIPVLSCGKNLFDKNKLIFGFVGDSTGVVSSDSNYITNEFIEVKPSCVYFFSGYTARIYFYDNEGQFISKNNLGAGTLLYQQNMFTTPSNCKFIRIRYVLNNSSSVIKSMEEMKNVDIQLEEGTVATPYEPYVEDKLTILSPVQLEKVGDVADRIVCKDGVWGVEKNVKTYYFDGSEKWSRTTFNNGGVYFKTTAITDNLSATWNILCNNAVGKQMIASYDDLLTYAVYFDAANGFRITGADFQNMSSSGEVQSWVISKGLYIKYQTTNPQFIPLSHDQQIKLRTFANKTNISFGCEIEGTIKAQVPKSLGATVNTHTEQINNLNKELGRVKKLEESTVSTVTTESDFTTVEATSNGYFEDVKLEGKTLVNLANAHAVVGTGSDTKYTFDGEYYSIQKTNGYTLGISFKSRNDRLEANKTYTIIINNKSEIQTFLYNTDYAKIFNLSNGVNIIKYTPSSSQLIRVGDVSSTSTEGLIKFSILILEGDHTQNPPSYFEGLKSVSDGVDEIVVSSVNENLLHNDNFVLGNIGDNGVFIIGNDTIIDDEFYSIIPNVDYTFKSYGRINNQAIIINRVVLYDENYNFLYRISPPMTSKVTFNITDTKAKYVKFIYRNPTLTNIDLTQFKDSIKLQLNIGDVAKNFVKGKSDKKRLLYYNDETQSWEKPILRQWDSIEKHADGKYYYHQRSGEVVLNGSENWNGNSSTTNKQINTLYCEANFHAYGGSWKDKNSISDKFNICDCWVEDVEGMQLINQNKIRLNILKSKLSTQDVQGFKQWLQANNVTVVYQLAQEKVYECTNIDLITYANETNYIVECGAIVPRSTLKVHNNISNVVSLLQKKVSLLENNITSYMITQNRLQLSSTYSADSVTFKVDYAVCSENRSQENYNTDLYNLILNNILVGKDNYDYDHMFNIIMDYASWSQISWDQFDILVGIMDLQHNPPIEPPIEEVPCETPEE